jgi:hypothetical protein
VITASAPAAELLALDDAEPWADLCQHPVILSVLAGEAPLQLVRDLIGALYPVFTGRARYLLAAKVSFLEIQDGKSIFEDLHRSLTVADADADAGFALLASALGFSDEEIASLCSNPLAPAEDLVEVVRRHSHRSAHEGIGTALVLDRGLPRLLGQLATALRQHYSVPAAALAHLEYRAAEGDAAQARVTSLATRYLSDPFQVFEARRAAREVNWGMTALIEEAARG